MPMAAGRNLCLRQAEWVSGYCLLKWEPWNTSVASAKKRSDTEREEFLYVCNFRLCVASSLTHQSFLNGVKLLIVDKFITGEKGMVIHLEFCSTIFRLRLLLPCRCCLCSFALTCMLSIWGEFQLLVYNVLTRIFDFQLKNKAYDG